MIDYKHIDILLAYFFVEFREKIKSEEKHSRKQSNEIKSKWKKNGKNTYILRNLSYVIYKNNKIKKI